LLLRLFGILATASLVAVGFSAPASAQTNEPAYDAINISSAWDAGFLGQGMTIAVIDQGVNLTHPYFSGQVIDGVCVYQDSTSSRCPNGKKYQEGVQAASQRSIRGWYVESEDHGNMVAGILAGKPNQYAPGGVAPQAKLLMANTDMQPASVVAALNYIYENRAKHNIVAVSMSFGILGLESREDLLNCNSNPVYSEVRAILKKLRAVGVISFASAGNGFYLNSVESWAPTCLDEAVSIGSIDANGDIAIYNTMSTKVELLAPDYAISASTYDYIQSSGTSAAAPMVAASYTLLRQMFPAAPAETVLSAMKTSGKKIDDVVRKQIPTLDLEPTIRTLTGMEVAFPIQTQPAQVETAKKVTVGSYDGYIAIYTKGYEGRRLTAKVAGKWLTVDPIITLPGSNFSLTKRPTGSGYLVQYQVYIDGAPVAEGVVATR
jgi:subtilisin family serine protease